MKSTHYVISNPKNGGSWTATGRIDFVGLLSACKNHLQQWEVADSEARENGFDSASCDTRFIISVAEYDANFS